MNTGGSVQFARLTSPGMNSITQGDDQTVKMLLVKYAAIKIVKDFS